MVGIKVPGVKLYRDRGKLYAYHRRTGTRIREPLGTAAFVAEIERLNAQFPPPATQMVRLHGASAHRAMGIAVLQDRADGLPWKTIAYKYGKSKTWLLKLSLIAKNDE